MVKLEDICKGSQLTGVVGDKVVTAVAVEWFGTYALTLTYRTEDNVLGETMLYRDMEPNLRLVSSLQWTFDADRCPEQGQVRRGVARHRKSRPWAADVEGAVHRTAVRSDATRLTGLPWLLRYKLRLHVRRLDRARERSHVVRKA